MGSSAVGVGNQVPKGRILRPTIDDQLLFAPVIGRSPEQIFDHFNLRSMREEAIANMRGRFEPDWVEPRIEELLFKHPDLFWDKLLYAYLHHSDWTEYRLRPYAFAIALLGQFPESKTVIDPFAGSGTTLVQANELAINRSEQDHKSAARALGLKSAMCIRCLLR